MFPIADHGSGLISELPTQMAKDYGKGFDVINLRKWASCYMPFPKRATVWRELSWTHYKNLMREDKAASGKKTCLYQEIVELRKD